MRNAVLFVESKSILLCLIILFSGSECADCGEIYVDNRAGNNSLNGIAPKITGGKNGPVKTIRRALEYVKPGDKIILIKNEAPYYESISLSGKRFSGLGQERFTIQGNGAIISGEIKIPVNGWQQLGNGLWKITPFRKGYFNLFRNGKSLPEYQPEDKQPVQVNLIPPGKWAVSRGAIYYRGIKNQLPPTEAFSLAGNSTGLTLIDVEGVYISGLTFEKFRLDGINIHDRSKNIILENVTCTENGRAGLAVNGTSQVEVIDSKLIKNRMEDLLITEQALVNLKKTELSKKVSISK